MRIARYVKVLFYNSAAEDLCEELLEENEVLKKEVSVLYPLKI